MLVVFGKQPGWSFEGREKGTPPSQPSAIDLRRIREKEEKSVRIRSGKQIAFIFPFCLFDGFAPPPPLLLFLQGATPLHA